MFFCCCFVISCQRINMSIILVDIINWSFLYKTKPCVCPITNSTCLSKENGEYDWSAVQITQVLTSYFYGLALTQIPAELLVERLSPKFIAFIGMFLSSIFTYFTPRIIKLQFGPVIVIQMIKAAGHATSLAAFSVMAGQWIPTKKLIRFVATATSGIQVGAFVTVLLSGIFSKYGTVDWCKVFYITANIGFVWCILWLYLCFSFRFGPVLSSSRTLANFPRTDLQVPIREILLSKPFWGYVAAGIATYWMIALNIFLMPIIVRVLLGICIEWNALVSSFPNVLQAFLYLISFGILNKKSEDKTTRRRLSMSLGMSSFATCMVLLTFVNCEESLQLLLLIFAIGAAGFNIAALAIIPVDMSPNFSGILAGIMNTIGALAGSGLPIMVGFILSDKSGLQAWNRTFYASAFVIFISMILLMAYSSCDRQPWNCPEEASNFKSAASSRSTTTRVLQRSSCKIAETRFDQQAEPRASKDKMPKMKTT